MGMPICGRCAEAYGDCLPGHEYVKGPSLNDHAGVAALLFRLRNETREARAEADRLRRWRTLFKDAARILRWAADNHKRECDERLAAVGALTRVRDVIKEERSRLRLGTTDGAKFARAMLNRIAAAAGDDS